MVSKDKIIAISFSICVAMQITVLMGRILATLSIKSGMHDAILYVTFIAASVLVFVISKSTKPLWYLAVEAGITFLLLSAVFKSTIYDNSPALANAAVITLLVMAVLIKLFQQEIPEAYKNILTVGKRFLPWGSAIACVIIIMFVYIPDLKRVLAEIFIGEQAHHMDFFIMSPGLSILHDGLPYVDVISQYGLGLPFILSHVSLLFGGFDYLPVLRMIVFFGIGYFIFFYFFTRAWLGSALLAFAAFLVVFRLQMFHYGVSPLGWIYPSSTPIRFGLDLLWLWLLWRHMQSGRPIFLLLAAAYSGFAVYYMTSSGMCVLVTFYLYLLTYIIVPYLRKDMELHAPTLIAAAILPLLTGFILFWLTLGGHVWKPIFWHNMIEYITFFAHGHAGGVLPMHESLKYRNYWVAFMAIFLPLLYLGTAISLSLLLYFKKIDRMYFLAVMIAMYGLISYQYFVVRSAMTSYYISAVPFVLICAFWIHIILKQMKKADAQKLKWACVCVALYALVSNHNYISYPNMLNFSANPMVDKTVAQRFPDRQGYFHHLVKGIKEQDMVKYNAAGDQDERLATEDSFKTDQELITFVDEAYDYSNDAKLIASLTTSKERVAVISSQETKILIQAKRAPFFYHTPLITSQPMRVRYFPNDAAHSPKFLQDTLAQLERDKPNYVFVQNVYLQDYPESYRTSHGNILTILGFIGQHYIPFKRGEYLTAMKRKD